MKVENKTIVVTGGGNGIGRELTLSLLERGARVAAVDISESGLQETVGLAGSGAANLSVHQVDITDREAVEALPEQVIAKHSAVDGIINNAGIIQPFIKIRELDYEAIDKVMNVNFYGTLYMTKAFLPYLLERPEAHIANISSMGGFLPVPGQSIYGAAKAAVKLMTEGLSAELQDTRVKVTVIFPGAIGTNITANSGVAINVGADVEGRQPAMKPMAPSKAAQMIIDGIEKDRFRILVGSDARFLDYFYRASPKRAARFIAKQMKSLLTG